jgi:uncharacterized protein YdeI (YjbR/CyaY-like superfamily)
MEATFFSSGADFRRWLEEHSAKSTELWVGYFKAASGHASVTWPESVDHALCYGWIGSSAQKKEETRQRRIKQLIADSLREQRIKQFLTPSATLRLSRHAPD